jgi:hypothetical protein
MRTACSTSSCGLPSDPTRRSVVRRTIVSSSRWLRSSGVDSFMSRHPSPNVRPGRAGRNADSAPQSISGRPRVGTTTSARLRQRRATIDRVNRWRGHFAPSDSRAFRPLKRGAPDVTRGRPRPTVAVRPLTISGDGVRRAHSTTSLTLTVARRVPWLSAHRTEGRRVSDIGAEHAYPQPFGARPRGGSVAPTRAQ